MALGDSRRAGGRAMVRERRSYNGQADRQAIGTNNTSERRGVEVVDELNSLVSPARTKPALRAIPPIGPVPAKRGTGTYKAPASGTGGAGIASPLVEESADAREYFESALIPTTDGMAWARFKSVKKTTMKDANAAVVVIEYKNALEAP